MKKSEVALQIRDGNEALRYSGKKRALIIYLFIYYAFSSFFFSTWYVTSGTAYQVGKNPSIRGGVSRARERRKEAGLALALKPSSFYEVPNKPREEQQGTEGNIAIASWFIKFINVLESLLYFWWCSTQFSAVGFSVHEAFMAN